MPDAVTSSPRDTIRPLLRTRQVREFTDEPLTDAELEAIADAGRWSGSSGNEQPWRFIVIRDVATLRALHDLGLPQTRSLKTATAAVAVVLPSQRERLVSDAYDDGRAAERMLIAANMLGLGGGIAWVRFDTLDAVRGLLGAAGGSPRSDHPRTRPPDRGRPAPQVESPARRVGRARKPSSRSAGPPSEASDAARCLYDRGRPASWRFARMQQQHSITMLGTGLIGDFYTATLNGQRGRDRVRVVYSRSAERGEAFRTRTGSPRARPTSRRPSTTPTPMWSWSACRTSSTRRRSGSSRRPARRSCAPSRSGARPRRPSGCSRPSRRRACSPATSRTCATRPSRSRRSSGPRGARSAT